MDIEFKNRKLARLCADSTAAYREWGQQVADKVLLRITQLRVMVNLAEADELSSLGLHVLRGKRAGQFAVGLHGGMRLIIRPLPQYRPVQSTMELAAIVAIEILEVTNYHD